MAWTARAQEQPPLSYVGSEYFRFFLYLNSLKPLSNFTDAVNSPHDTVLVCVGDVRWINQESKGELFEKFVRAGGSVLIATDSQCVGNHAESWESRFGVKISGNLLTADPKDCSGMLEGRPFAKPRRRPLFDANRDSPFVMFKDLQAAGPKAVATDLPSEMTVAPLRPPGMTVTQLAGYPDTARPINAALARDDRGNNFAVSLQVNGGSGRVLVVADHSVFVNGQMKANKNEETKKLDPLTGNIPFTNQMIEWLKGPAKSRTRCLFMQDGVPMTEFARQGQAASNTMPPIPPIAPDRLANMLLSQADPMIAHLQDQARPNDVLNRWLGPSLIRRGFLILVSLILLWMIWNRVSGATRSEDRSRWASLATLGGLLPKGSTNKRKRADLIDTGNVYEAARWRVRDRFDRLGGQPTEAGHMPPFLMADQSRQSVGLEQQVRRLWNIGYGPRPVPVPIHLWDELNLDLERAIRLARKGVWCFAASAAVGRKA